MSAPTFRLVFQGKIAPNADLAEVKSRLQQLFKKDAATIDKMFSGKKVALKQGLTDVQVQQYQEKMRSIGVLCEIESQTPQARARSAPANTPVSVPTTSPVTTATAAQPVNSISQGYVANTNAAAAAPVSLKLVDIDKAFTGTLPKVEPPTSYKAGIVAVGIAMVLLPMIYVGLIALLGLGVITHTISSISWIQSLGYKFGVIAYITPIVAGLTVILFMIKPLFARPAAAPKTIVLDPLKEPIFFHFVNKIAMAVGAPRPKQIVVDCEVNASASFRKGLFSFFGDDLVLTIGMPLLAGFNTRQLAGVLAHEFGHFSQGVGMRFHYLTYKVNSWFFHAVYLRDKWDEKLNEAAEEADGWISVILNFARGGVWATRKVLYGFMMAGHAVSSYMLRQMEFDADRYEAHMAGSEQFKNTALQLQRLGMAFQVSHAQLAQAWEDKKLVDNLPRLIAHNATQLPDELDHALLNQMREAKTRVYDSHPSDNERIDNAMAQQAKGIFEMVREGRDLFKSFDALAKQVSNSYYAHELGLEFDKNKLVDVNQVVKITRDNEKQQEAYHLYFKDMAPVFELSIAVNIFDTSKVDWNELLNQYRSVNDQIIEQIGQRRQLMHQANDSYDKYQKLLAIDIFRDCGFVMFPEWFGMDEQAFAKYREMLPKLEQSWQQAMDQLDHMFALNDQRLSIALTLLNHPALIGANAEHAQHLKARNRMSLLINNFKRNAEFITDFEFKHFKLAALLSCAPLMGQKPDNLSAVMQSLLEEVKQAYDRLTAALGRLDYPFVADGEHLTIADYITDFLPNRNHCASEHEYYVKCGGIILEKLESIYARIISALANIALTVDRLTPAVNGQQQINGQINIQQNYFRENHVQDNHIQEHHVQENHVQENHVQENHVQENHVQENHVQENHVQEKHIQANQSIAADATPKAAVSSSNSAALSLLTNAASLEIAGEPEIAAQPAIPAAAIAAGSDTFKTVPAKKEPRNKAPSATVESKALPETQSKKIVAPAAAEPRAKAVFAIDDPMDKVDEKAQPDAAEPEVKPQGKAVFGIDDSKAEPEINNEKNDNKTANASTNAAAFEIALKPQSSELPTAAKSLEPKTASAVDFAGKPGEKAGLLLEPMDTSESSKPSNTNQETITLQTMPEAGSLPLSLEPLESVIAEETGGVASSTVVDAQVACSDAKPDQDSLVLESKAQVLTFESVEKADPAAKPNIPANTKTKAAVSGKLELEPVKRSEPSHDSSANTTDKDNKESSLKARG
ncbi:MAG: M48 family metalloprotease [Gammaproteobacteria bacterium]|nr:M48 family metalloprotease [Gammaproteobacteria bacterium]